MHRGDPEAKQLELQLKRHCLNNWEYQGKPFIDAPEEYQGFVYIIHDQINNMFYIGKKNFWTVKKLPPLKGKKNKRHSRIQSDWQLYYGSSERLSLMVKTLGEDNFTRTILHLCSNKTMMSYWETKTQFQLNVLTDPSYYNEFISCRINARGFKE